MPAMGFSHFQLHNYGHPIFSRPLEEAIINFCIWPEALFLTRMIKPVKGTSIPHQYFFAGFLVQQFL
jgi:hypothetical protein